MAPKKYGSSSNDIKRKCMTPLEVLKKYNVESLNDVNDVLLRQIYRLQDSYETKQCIQDNDGDDPIEVYDSDEAAGSSKSGACSTSVAVLPAIHPFRACEDMWSEHASTSIQCMDPEASSSKKRKSPGDHHTETICNGKGKAKTTDKGKGRASEYHWSKENCMENPRCLNYLGQAKWEGDNAFKMFSRQWGLGYNPLEDIKDPDLPVGLRNLGATCYANSLIQVWFQDTVFRNGVYSSRLVTSRPPEEQPLYQLQVVFGALQAGNTKAFNPVDLVKCLKLDSTEQQDAQEFAKLFMELLDEQFKKQVQDPRIKNLVSTQFEGTLSYTTKCMGCKYKSARRNTFRELEVTLKNNKSLEDLFENNMKPEFLRGDNQYRCDNCGTLQDAKRTIEILSLPPVLHFSLLRFVYDPELEDRKKTNAMISFPESLDMAQFMSEEVVADGEEIWYDLKGVLLHKGTSSYSGHYTAHVYDSRFRKWFLFDDDVVSAEDIAKDKDKKAASKPVSKDSKGHGTDTQSFYSSGRSSREPSTPSHPYNRKLGETLFPPTSAKAPTYVIDSTDDEDDKENIPTVVARLSTRTTPGLSAYKASPSTVYQSQASQDIDERSQKGASKRRKVEDEEDVQDVEDAQPRIIKSRDAYMLIYTKRISSSNSGSPPTSSNAQAPVIPERAMEKLREFDIAQATALDAYAAKETLCRADFERVREQKRSVYSCWSAASEDDDTGYLVSSAELTKWLVAEIDPPKEKKSKETKRTHVVVDDTGTEDEEYVSAKPAEVIKHSPHKGPRTPRHSEVQQDPADSSATIVDDPTHMDIDQVDSDAELPSISGAYPTSQANTPVVPEGRPASKSSEEECAQDNITAGASNPQVDDPKKELSTRQSSVEKRSKVLSGIKYLSNSELLCDHQKLAPKHANSVKCVSTRAISILQTMGVEIESELPAATSLCQLCVWQPRAERAYLKEHKAIVDDFDCVKRGQGNARWISKAWLSDWKKDCPSMHQPGRDDPPPDDDEYKMDTFCSCERAGLQPDQSKRVMVTGRQVQILQDLFPDWEPFTHETDVCPDCQEVYDISQTDVKENVRMAKEEQGIKALKSLMKRAVGHFSLKDYSARTTEELCYAVPHDWLHNWRKWLSKPAKISKPEAIDLKSYFCAHGKLLANFRFRGDADSFEIVSEDEWGIISKRHGNVDNLEIIVSHRTSNPSTTRQNPAVCTKCRENSRREFEKIAISLFFLMDADLDENGNLKDSIFQGTAENAISLCDDSTAEESDAQPADKGLRRSTRTKNAPSTSTCVAKKRKASQTLNVKRLDTFKDIRLRISKLMDAPVLCLRIFFKTREIENADETIESIGITEHEALCVYEVPSEDQEYDASRFTDVVPKHSTSSKDNKSKEKSNGRAEGFGGTGLLGYTPDGSQLEDIATALPGTCPACTYANHPDLKNCEICDTTL